MKRILLSLALGALWLSAPAQDIPANGGAMANVSVAAKGDDVRVVLHDLFQQAKKNYILEPGVRFALFLSLNDMEFEEALQLICKNAQLEFEIQNGIYFVNKAKAKPANKPETKPQTQPDTKPQTQAQTKAPVQKPDVKTIPKTDPKAPVTKPTGKLGEDVLKRRLTTKHSKIDIRELFADISKQTKVTIELDSSVPAYKLDAFLKDTSLKFALDTITKATALRYDFTNRQTILLTAKSSAKTGRQ